METAEKPTIPSGTITAPDSGGLSELETLRKHVDMYRWLSNSIKRDVMDDYYASRPSSPISISPIYEPRSSSSSSWVDALTILFSGMVLGYVLFDYIAKRKKAALNNG